MQRANIMLGIGGGRDTTVPKYGVSAAEIAILRAIHGDDSVHDVERVEDDTDLSNASEYARLRGVYGAHKDGEGNKTFDKVYPGAGARLIDKLADLGLPEEFYKATSRASASAKPKPALRGARAGAGPAAPTDEDGIGDLG